MTDKTEAGLKDVLRERSDGALTVHAPLSSYLIWGVYGHRLRTYRWFRRLYTCGHSPSRYLLPPEHWASSLWWYIDNQTRDLRTSTTFPAGFRPSRENLLDWFGLLCFWWLSYILRKFCSSTQRRRLWQLRRICRENPMEVRRRRRQAVTVQNRAHLLPCQRNHLVEIVPRVSFLRQNHF